MTEGEPVEIECSIFSIDRSIVGSLEDCYGNSMAFTGWIEFAAGLSSMVETVRQDSTNSEVNGSVDVPELRLIGDKP